MSNWKCQIYWRGKKFDVPRCSASSQNQITVNYRKQDWISCPYQKEVLPEKYICRDVLMNAYFLWQLSLKFVFKVHAMHACILAFYVNANANICLNQRTDETKELCIKFAWNLIRRQRFKSALIFTVSKNPSICLHSVWISEQMKPKNHRAFHCWLIITFSPVDGMF